MINDETLMLYYYGDELSAQEQRSVEAALASDTGMARRYRLLRDELEQLRATDERPAPTEAIVRWRYSLDHAIAGDRQRGRPWLWPLAAAAVLVLGIAIGVNLSGTSVHNDTDPRSVEIEPIAPPDPPTLPRPSVAFTRGLSAYMQQSRLQLVGLKDTDAERRIDLITEIIEQNRMFERAADANDAPELARVLRAFEQMLISLARDEAAPRDIASKSAQLSFEFAVMLTKLSRESSHTPTSL